MRESDQEERLLLKSVAVGFGCVGKTSALIRYRTGKFVERYVPTVWEEYGQSGELDGKPYRLCLWDTGGAEDYDRLRPLNYPETDVFMLLYDVSDSKVRFEEIHSYWWTELNRFCPDVPIILVGSKTDLRDSYREGIETISFEEGEAMAERIGAVKYMEISSLRDEGVTELFAEVVKVGYEFKVSAKHDGKKKKCVIT